MPDSPFHRAGQSCPESAVPDGHHSDHRSRPWAGSFEDITEKQRGYHGRLAVGKKVGRLFQALPMPHVSDNAQK